HCRTGNHRQGQPIETGAQFRQEQVDLLAHESVLSAAPIASRLCACRSIERKSGTVARSTTWARSSVWSGRYRFSASAAVVPAQSCSEATTSRDTEMKPYCRSKLS